MNITQPCEKGLLLCIRYHFKQNMEMKNKYFIENKLKNVT